MKQVMSARQAFECYVSDVNKGSQFLHAHAGSMYEAETHSYRMIFKKCNMSKADVGKYLKLFGVE